MVSPLACHTRAFCSTVWACRFGILSPSQRHSCCDERPAKKLDRSGEWACAKNNFIGGQLDMRTRETRLGAKDLEPDGEAPGVGYATNLAGMRLDGLAPTMAPSIPGW